MKFDWIRMRHRLKESLAIVEKAIAEADKPKPATQWVEDLKQRLVSWLEDGNEVWQEGSANTGLVVLRFVSKPKPKPAPKLYTFAEAYAMMKAGKWMKCLYSDQYQAVRFLDGWWFRKEKQVQLPSPDMMFNDFAIEGEWQEVTV